MDLNKPYPNFLDGKNEVLQTILTIEWTDHSLGEPTQWPTSLRIALNMVIHSEVPSVLFWGSEHYCFCNPVFLSYLPDKMQQTTITGQTAKNIWPDKWESLQSLLGKVIRNHQSINDENSLLADTCRSTCFSIVKDEEGNSAGVLAICAEPSSKSVSHKKVDALHEEKKQLLKSITDGFFILGNNWTVSHWNKKAEDLLSISREEITGKNLWNFFPDGIKERLLSEFETAMKERKAGNVELYYRKWGRWFNYHYFPYKEGLAVHFQDISTERRLQLISQRTEQISGVAGWEFDLTTEKVFITPKGYEIYGLNEGVEINLDINKQLFDKESLKKIDQAIKRAVERLKPYEIELDLIKKEENRVICINGFPLVRNGKVTKLYGTIEDITQEKRNKQKLEETIKKLKTAQKIGKMGSWTMDIQKDTNEWSDEMFNILEVDADAFEPTFENLLTTVHPDDKKFFQLDIKKVFRNQNYRELEHRIITPTGKMKWIRARIALHRGENQEPQILEGISQDITEEKRQEEEILRTLKEKETLLEEVHHRVKNNMAVISSMLQLQAYEEPSESVREKLLDSVVRIISMASIHEQLYQSNSFSKLDLSESLQKMVKKIVETIEYRTKIFVDYTLEPVDLNINQAIPCSLIINEVITNVVKHAFQGRSKGNILVTLTEKNDHIKISIEDDGIGIPEDFNIEESKTLGIRLINTLTEQLNAKIRYNPLKEGTSFILEFEKADIKGSGSFHFKE